MTVVYSILSRIQQAMSFFVRSLKPGGRHYLRQSLLDRKVYIASAYLRVGSTEFGVW